MNLQTLREKLENHKTRSYWAAGVKEYAAEIIDTLEEKEKFDVQARALYQAESLLNDLANGRK